MNPDSDNGRTESTTISPPQFPYPPHHTGLPRQYIHPAPTTHSPWDPPYSPTVHTQPATSTQPTVTDARVFRHIRDLSGIVHLEKAPSRRIDNPNFNAAANNYFWTHGYRRGTVQLIQQMFEEAPERNTFVERLTAAGGVSILEADYIYHLIEGGTNRL